MLEFRLPEPTIEDEVVDEADDNSEGEQVAPSEPGGPSVQSRPIMPIGSSRLTCAAFGAFLRTSIQGNLWLGGVGWPLVAPTCAVGVLDCSILTKLLVC